LDREVPLEPDLVCDRCGAVGAYDFMGDILCWGCAGKESEDVETFDTLEGLIVDLRGGDATQVAFNQGRNS